MESWQPALLVSVSLGALRHGIGSQFSGLVRVRVDSRWNAEGRQRWLESGV